MLSNDFLSILTKISQKKHKTSEFNLLVETLCKIAITYVKNNNRFHKLPFKLSDDTDIKSFAFEAVSYLFIKNTNGDYPICVSFSNWEPKITNENETKFFLNKITASRLDQHLIQIYKEHDPLYSKILDSLNYSIKKDNLLKVKFLGQTLVLRRNSNNENKQIIAKDVCNEIPSSYFNYPNCKLESIFRYLENQGYRNPAIPLNLVINKIKHSYHNNIQKSEGFDFIESKIDSEVIVKEGYYHTVDKINDYYYKKGKINKNEKIIFEKTLFDIANDLLHNNFTFGLYNYFRIHSNDISKTEYQNKYHNVIEYLLKFMKNRISELILHTDYA